MVDTIRLKRGNNTDFASVTLQAGEPAFVLDSGDLYVGDGTNKIHINAVKTKSDIGLGNVDNTSDVNKPVSTVQQTALNLKVNTSQIDTNIALGTDDTKIPSQKAVKAYIDAAIAGDITIDGGSF